MKIHERPESKAVDIHIQKMASLTLNGHHYARPTNTRARCARARGLQRAGYGSQGWRSASGNVVHVDRRRRLRGAPPSSLRDIAVWHATIEGPRYHFKPFHSKRV